MNFLPHKFNLIISDFNKKNQFFFINFVFWKNIPRLRLFSGIKALTFNLLTMRNKLKTITNQN